MNAHSSKHLGECVGCSNLCEQRIMSTTTKSSIEEHHDDRRALARRTKPIPCYAVHQIPPKCGDDDLYTIVLPSVVKDSIATLIETIEIPPCDARSWIVPAGCLWRIICHAGPQVADMNCWNLHNPQEHFYSSKTRQLHATHVTTGDRLWSNMPYIRPLATITYDTIAYGYDSDGAGVHDVIGSRCDPYTHAMLTSNGNHTHHTCCHSNLTRQCIRDGLREEHVHDVLNVFMCTGFTKDTHQYFTKPSPVQIGDYIEFIAETDLRVAASTCPQGDVSLPCGNDDVVPTVYPLKVEVYKLPDGLLEQKGWKPSTVNDYSGNHGSPNPVSKV
jgi:uncharacterized protein